MGRYKCYLRELEMCLKRRVLRWLGRDVEVSEEVADDRGSLAEAAAAIFVLGVASSIVISFAFTSMKNERIYRLRAEALSLLEEYSAGARRIDCIQHLTDVPVACSKEKILSRPADNGDVMEPAVVDFGAGPYETGNELIRIEWKDYYTVEDCKNPKGDVPRAVREITVEWDDGAGAKNKKITRYIPGPAISPSWGWAVNFDSPTSLAPGDYLQERFSYTLVVGSPASGSPASHQDFWSSMHVTTVGDGASAEIGECTIFVGPIGQYKDTNSPPNVCKLAQGLNTGTGADACL